MPANPYDYEPETQGGLFIKLSSKGDQCEVRLASAPVHELKVWKKGEQKPIDSEKIASLSAEQLAQVKRNAKYRWGEQFTWVVIDRSDNSARVLTLPVSFYRKVKELVTNPKWGDITKYDITVTRTEEPGANYYSVIPSPEKSDLTAEELELVGQVNLKELKPYAKATGTFGENVQPVAPKADAGSEDSDLAKDVDDVLGTGESADEL